MSNYFLNITTTIVIVVVLVVVFYLFSIFIRKINCLFYYVLQLRITNVKFSTVTDLHDSNEVNKVSEQYLYI